MTDRPGIGGSLFPSAFLASVDAGSTPGAGDSRRSHVVRWWTQVEKACGPATALRTLFDVAAMPLAGLLGFRARDARFSSRAATAVLDSCGSRVQLVLLPWSARLPAIWRDLHAEHAHVRWGLVVAPPFVSIVDLGGQAVRRSVDFRFPHVLDARSLDLFLLLCQAAAFSADERSMINGLIAQAARHQGAVRRDLQHGVVTALSRLAPWLRAKSFDEALTIVYRLLFLLFAESRHLTAAGDAEAGAAYGLTRLCRDAWRTRETRGLWSALAAITRLSRAGCQSRSLIVAPFNGHLFSREAAPTLEAGGRARQASAVSAKRDDALGQALVALGSRPANAGREDISYADLGVEQLGAVYERVLDLDPGKLVRSAPERLDLRAHSARRKESGTFYTPQPLAEYVVRRTLAPLVRQRTADEILRLRIVDPAMGSGAFLVAACRYLADAHERALIDEGRYGEGDFDETRRAGIRRLVAARCLAGVDVNPTAVQLARLSLWLATLARDKPLTFLDHQLRTGNSLVGATPADLWRVRLRASRSGRDHPLLEDAGLEEALRDVLPPVRELHRRPDDTVADVHARERLWRHFSGPASPIAAWRLACDLWCSQWFTDATNGGRPGGTRAAIDAVLKGDRVLPPEQLRVRMEEARAAAARARFFHWPLEFPDVFHDDEGVAASSRGFDAVIGNPPWEMLRRGGGTSHSRDAELSFIRESGLYLSCGRGHLNLYQPFVERALSLVRPGGRAGLVVPWSIATDDGSARLRRQLLQDASVDVLLGLDNAHGLFPIHRGLRFAALVAVKGGGGRELPIRTGIKTAAEIEALPDSDDGGPGAAGVVRVSPATLQLISGPSLRIPDVRSRRDLEWLARIARRYPPLGSRDGWHVSFGRELNVTEDRAAFGDKGLPVIDGKHIAQFTVTPAAGRCIDPREAARRLPDRRFTRTRLAYRDVSGVGNRHTVIAAIVPAGVVTTHTLFCLRERLDDERQHFLCGVLNSMSINAYVRMFMGSHVTTSLVEHIPVPVWTGDADQRAIAGLAAALSRSPIGGRDQTSVRAELDQRVARLYAHE